jgi:hypothetical protein
MMIFASFLAILLANVTRRGIQSYRGKADLKPWNVYLSLGLMIAYLLCIAIWAILTH